jgi:hypothetical protein
MTSFLAAIAVATQLGLAFVPVDGTDVANGVVDVGIVTYAEHGVDRLHASRITKRIGVLVSGPAGGKATLRAWLESPDPRCRVRIDGQELTAMPRVIDAGAAIGVVTTHRLEIDVPAGAAEGALFSSVAWEVTTN